MGNPGYISPVSAPERPKDFETGCDAPGEAVKASAPGDVPVGDSGKPSGKSGKGALCIPPTQVDPEFKREPGQAGRAPVYHEFLKVVGRRLRRHRGRRRAAAMKWDRLSGFRQEVLFLTWAGYSAGFVRKVFVEELPNLFPKLSKGGVAFSVGKALESAEKGETVLDDVLREVLSRYEVGPWGKAAESWMKDQYGVDPGVPDTAPVVLVSVPEGEGCPEPVGIAVFSREWASYRSLRPSAGEPTDEEVVIGIAGGLAAVLRYRISGGF